MDPTTPPDSVARLEVRLRRVTLLFGLAIVAVLLLLAFAWFTLTQPDELTLRTLRIVDQRGIERVRVGGQLPDAVVNGGRVARGDQAAGVLIYDDAGQERGGYVTFNRSRNAVLTLDTRKGMVVLLAADSSDGAALRLWGADFGDWLDLRASSAGAHLTVGRENNVVLQEPPLTDVEVAAFCGGLEGELRQLKVQPPAQQVLRACQQRMPDTACRKCLELR